MLRDYSFSELQIAQPDIGLGETNDYIDRSYRKPEPIREPIRELEPVREPVRQHISIPITKPQRPVVHVEERRTVSAVQDEQEEPEPAEDSPELKNAGVEFATNAGYGVDLNAIFAEYWQWVAGAVVLFFIVSISKK